jgi:hypothetical protein
MKRIGIGGVLAAAIALAVLSAPTVVAAAGGPEYLACGKAAKVNKKYTGHYTNKLCSEVSLTNEGKYEHAAAKLPIKTKSKFGATTIYLYNPIEHKLASEVPCEKGVESGTITGSREGTLALTYTGCSVPATFKNGEKSKFVGPCNSPGKKEGEVVTEPLATKLVWLDEEEKVPGILVSAAEPGGVFEEVLCAGGEVKVKQTGSLLAKVTPANEVTKLITATFTASSTTGEPEFGEYWEGGTPTEVKLFSELKAEKFGIEYPAVPTSENSTIAQKSGKVLIG